MDRVTGNTIRKIKPLNKFNTLQGLSSLEKKIIKLPANQKIQFAQIFNYLNIVLRSRYSGVKMDKNIRYFDYKYEQGNFPITNEGVKLALKNIVEDIGDDEIKSILNICTHNHAFLDSVTSYTKTAEVFMKCINIKPDYTELKHIKEVLDSNLKVKFKDKKFYEILFLCANNNLDNINLESTDLSGLNMKNISLKNANLKKVKFIGTILENANLENANLENTILENANIENVSFKKANITNGNLKKIKGSKTKFDDANLTNCDMEDAEVTAAYFKKSILNNANMHNTKLKEAKFIEASLINADFTDADLDYIDIYKCDMSYTTFTGNKFYGTNLSNSNFSNAHMENTQFISSKFGGATFNNTNLTGAHFENCDLNNVNFNNANLQKSDFLFDDSTCLIDGLNYLIISINQIKICGADFTDATFRNTLFNLWLPTEKDDLDSWISNKNNSTKQLLKTIYSIESPNLKSSTTSNNSTSTTSSFKESSSDKLRLNSIKQIMDWVSYLNKKNHPMFSLIYSDLNDFISNNEIIKLDSENIKLHRTSSF